MRLECKNLVCERGAFRAELRELRLGAAEIVALVGPSGSGKSTLLDAIAGFAPLTEGEIRVDGHRVDKLPPEKRRIALAFQQSALFPHLNVRDNIAFGLQLQKIPRVQSRRDADTWLERVNLKGFGDRAVHELSVGQAQRVALARALAPGFPAVLLDEPFASVDHATRSELRQTLRALAEDAQAGILLVTHDPQDVRELSRRVLEQQAGTIVWSGSTHDWCDLHQR